MSEDPRLRLVQYRYCTISFSLVKICWENLGKLRNVRLLRGEVRKNEERWLPDYSSEEIQGKSEGKAWNGKDIRTIVGIVKNVEFACCSANDVLELAKRSLMKVVTACMLQIFGYVRRMAEFL
jgi:hypothetical protein